MQRLTNVSQMWTTEGHHRYISRNCFEIRTIDLVDPINHVGIITKHIQTMILKSCASHCNLDQH